MLTVAALSVWWHVEPGATVLPGRPERMGGVSEAQQRCP